MKKLTGLLVGMHFNPPSKWLLQGLPAGCRLGLEKEPENPYDPNAVVVWLVDCAAIPSSQHEKLRELLDGTGFDLEEILAEPAIKLGHLAAEGGKPLKANPGYSSNLAILNEMEARGRAPDFIRLGFGLKGEPVVNVEWADGGEA